MVSLIKNTRKPDITFFRDGRILITARIVRILALLPGDAINIAVHNYEIPYQREQRQACLGSAECSLNFTKSEYLLYAIHNPVGRHEAQCYPTKRGSHNFCANSIRLSRALLDACNIPDQKASFMMGEGVVIQNETYCPIITRKPL